MWHDGRIDRWLLCSMGVVMTKEILLDLAARLGRAVEAGSVRYKTGTIVTGEKGECVHSLELIADVDVESIQEIDKLLQENTTGILWKADVRAVPRARHAPKKLSPERGGGASVPHARHDNGSFPADSGV